MLAHPAQSQRSQHLMRKARRHLLPASPAHPEVTGAAPQACVSCTFQHQPPRAVPRLERTRPNPASYYLSPGCGGNFGCLHLQLCFCLTAGNKPLLQLLISWKYFLERLPPPPLLWDRTCCGNHLAPHRPSGGLVPHHTPHLLLTQGCAATTEKYLPWKVRPPLTSLTYATSVFIKSFVAPRFTCGVTAQLLPTPPQGPAELSSSAGFAPAGQVQPPPGEEPRASPPGNPPSPSGCRRGGTACPQHLPMSELQKASCGWMGTQVQASTTKSRRLQLQRNTARKLSHAVMLPPRCLLLTSAEQEGSRWPDSLFLTARTPRLPACLPSLCLAGPGSAAFTQQDSASRRARQFRGSQQLRAPMSAEPRCAATGRCAEL